MASPREYQTRIINLLLAARNALAGWERIEARARLRGTIDETQRWLKDDAERERQARGPSPEAPRTIGGRLPYSED